MPKFVLTYHGLAEMPTEPDAIAAVMKEWETWYGTIGSDLVDGGAPFGAATAIGPDGSQVDAPAQMSGYTIISAADLESAATVAKGCPVLTNGHTVQISEAIDM